MKNITVLASICLLLTSGLFLGCNNESSNASTTVADNNITANNPDAQNPEPTFKFEHTDWDFGQINEGEKVRHSFKFTNVGNEALVIRTCRASCGCTVPKCDRKPVEPGESSEIVVTFDSNGKPGNQIKNVTVTANTNPPETVLTFRSVVIPNNQ